ncbi:MAG: DUF58 domain-containing protein [Lysobacterales bacterium]
MRERLAQWRERAQRYAETRLPALTRYRQPEPLPIQLHRRRIYILPTRFGIYAAGLLGVMLLGALNFNNNAALLLTFALGGVMVLSPLRAVQALDGALLERVDVKTVHAGESTMMRMYWRSDSTRRRIALDLTSEQSAIRFDLVASAEANLQLSTERRGWQPLPWLMLASDAPFGLFRAWSVLRPLQPSLVWPHAEAIAAPMPDRGSDVDRRARITEGEDWEGLRDYRPGDPPRRVAWKASARSERLLVREPALPAAGPLDLRWDDTAVLPFEQRISRMTRWVIDAAASGRRYRMQLPAQTFGPDRGPDFRNRCLRALALL